MGITYTEPFTALKVVVLSATFSMRPVCPATVTMSPTLQLPSSHRNMPLMMSFISVWQPKARAKPLKPASAIRLATSTPSVLSAVSTMAKYITILNRLMLRVWTVSPLVFTPCFCR